MEYPARLIKGREQSTREHSCNVSELCAQTMSQLGLSALGKITGLIHDAGKLTNEFIEYLRRNNRAERGTVNHSAAGAEYIYNRFYLTEKNSVNKLTAQLIINSVYSHHGRLYDCINTEAQNEFLIKMDKHSDCGYEEIMKIFFDEILSEEEIEKLFYAACDEVNTVYAKLGKFGNFGTGMIQKLLYSALIDADRYDAYCFESGAEFGEAEMPDWSAALNAMEEKAESFKPDTPINKMRCDISRKCREAAGRGGGIYRLSVPTGSGKTLSSLRFALNFAHKNKSAHIFYVIPYTTIIDQTAKEVREICGGDMVLEHHSGIIVEDDDEAKKYSLLTERWQTPVILTTVVQFMNALYAGKSACARRMRALCGSVIIIDEVQTVPRKMLNLFNEALNFLAEICGSTVLLCTATPPTLEKLSAHPLRLAQNCDIAPMNVETERVFKRTETVNLCSDKGMTLDEIARLAEEQAQDVGSVLVVMNKVSQARLIYDSIGIDCEKIYLSTKKCGKHRLETIEYIKKRTAELRENSAEGKKLIVVSTQLVEAGVDFSFECVIRALAGVDSLAQAAGRCNRSGEYDKLCKVFIVNVADEKLGMLEDIRLAKQSTENILLNNKNADLLLPETVQSYYSDYFKVREDKLDDMDYIIDGKDTIMDLLSGNRNYTKQYGNKYKVPPLRQAFRTAGEKFRVIDSATYSIVIPYGDGKKYAEDLTGGADIYEKLKTVKKCGIYTVNVYEWELKRLKESGSVYFAEDIGVWIARNGSYTEEYGLKAADEQEFLGC
ncbi:MAG: CRISPR-associated helicase Cas3' [Firmicutes bacterium]|nr:CRISPR-associated helicase Cas3' [Bacillota bacterium]